MATDILNGQDFCTYLIGTWKRNLQWRHFGGAFGHIRSTNNIVSIDENQDAAVQPDTKFLTWSFGKSLEDLVPTYTIQFLPQENTDRILMEWSFEGTVCHGFFDPKTNMALFHFALSDSMATITYRLIDSNSTCVIVLYLKTSSHL